MLPNHPFAEIRVQGDDLAAGDIFRLGNRKLEIISIAPATFGRTNNRNLAKTRAARVRNLETGIESDETLGSFSLKQFEVYAGPKVAASRANPALIKRMAAGYTLWVGAPSADEELPAITVTLDDLAVGDEILVAPNWNAERVRCRVLNLEAITPHPGTKVPERPATLEALATGERFVHPLRYAQAVVGGPKVTAAAANPRLVEEIKAKAGRYGATRNWVGEGAHV